MTEYNFTVNCVYNKRYVDFSKVNGPGNRTPSYFIHVEAGGKGQGETTGLFCESISQLEIVIYPNPSSGNFTIEFLSNKSNTLSISVVDILGKIVASESWIVYEGENRKGLDLFSLSSGVYTVLVKNEEGVSQQRIIIQH